MKRFAPVVFVILLLGAAGATGVWRQYQHFLQQPLSIEADGFTLDVRAGESIRSVLAGLEKPLGLALATVGPASWVDHQDGRV